MKRATVKIGILLLEKMFQIWPSDALPKLLLLVRVQSHDVSIDAVFWFGQQPLIMEKSN